MPSWFSYDSTCEGVTMVCSTYEPCETCSWSPLGEFDECTENCGGGQHKRIREGYGIACETNIEEEFQDCNIQQCIRKSFTDSFA